MITEQDYHFIAKFDQGDESHKIDLICSLGVDALDLLLSIINRMSKDQTVAYLLMRLDTIINDPSIHQILETYAQKYGVHPWTNFMNLLNRQDMFIAHMSARLISKVLVNSKTLMDGSDLEFYFGWLRSQLVELKQDYLQSSVSCLMNILKINFYREEFYEFDGIGQLMPLLNPTYGFQLQYQVCFCFWLLSYHTKIVSKFQENMKILTTLSDVLKDSQKVKVIRMIIATFVNILKKHFRKSCL